MTNELKQHVADNPQISHVYFNEKGEWQFYPKAGYNKVLTRDQVAKIKVVSETASGGTRSQLSTGTGHITEAAQAKGVELTDAQKAWLAQMPTGDLPYSEQPDGTVKGPDYDGDGLVDGAGSDQKRVVEEKIVKNKEDKK